MINFVQYPCYIDIVEDVQAVGDDIVQTIARRWFRGFKEAHTYVDALAENAVATRIIPANLPLAARAAKPRCSLPLSECDAAARAKIEAEGYRYQTLD